MQFLSGGQLCSLNVQDITKWLQRPRQFSLRATKEYELWRAICFSSVSWQVSWRVLRNEAFQNLFAFSILKTGRATQKIPCIKNLVSYCQLYWKKTAGILASWNLVLYFYFMPVSVRLCVVNESCDLKVFWWLNKDLRGIHTSEALLKIVKLTLRL